MRKLNFGKIITFLFNIGKHQKETKQLLKLPKLYQLYN